ncbi:efflux RND transporter periplasmic adaptor subunit [Arsukibacterium sp.]|uniref:efflux RND transporter periplasmic adaptor subunit n=1 Tax=Arsukibacterium sp. TaxID=1977258 RepID=UPI00299E9149|nr:efflux RND transporter periplasmic adaptor subunit [Arsukibacterium sp.]MDX1677117.1 efflux RND transporter periplasmic adaptor subunit [Arsukibacterium sp.]
MTKTHSRLIWVILLALVVFVGFLNWQQQQSTASGRGGGSPVAVSTAKVTVKPMIRQITAIGNGIANHSVQLVAPVSDFLIELNIQEGKQVKAGDIIARLNNVQQLARIAELSAILTDQRRQLERLENLATTQATAQSLLDEQQTRVNTTLAQIDIAKAQLNDLTIRAPFDGYLGLRQVSEGAYVNAGTVLTTLDDLNTLKVEFSVAEHYLAEIKRGMPVTVTNVAYGDVDFIGQVSAIDTRLDPVTRSIRVHATLDNSDLRLRPGMLLNVKVELSNVAVLQISERALIPQQNQQFVFVVNSDNTVSRREVDVGQRIPGWVEITSGLAEGEEIVVEGIQKVRPGIKINRVGAR